MSKREKQIYRKAYVEGIKTTLLSITVIGSFSAMFVTALIREGIFIFN